MVFWGDEIEVLGFRPEAVPSDLLNSNLYLVYICFSRGCTLYPYSCTLGFWGTFTILSTFKVV